MTTLARVDAISDRTLNRLLRWGVVALVLLLAAFSALYYLGRHVDSGPSLADRQVASAEEALKANPDNVANRIRLASVYRSVGRIDDAKAQYDEVLRAVPGNRTALLGEGKLLMDTGDLDGAVTAFTKITKDGAKGEFAGVDPNLQGAHYYLAQIALQRNDAAQAIAEAKAALAIDGGDADALFLLGNAQSKSGDEKSAVASYTSAVAFVPTGWCDPYAAMASSYQKLGNADGATYAGAMNAFCGGDAQAATEQLSRITSGPMGLQALLGLGLVAETVPDKAAAQKWYAQALAKDPSNLTAKNALARLGGSSASTSTDQTGTQAKAK